MKVRTLIVDDMPLARERVKRFLRGEAAIEIVGEAANGREAVAAIESLSPDLVLLDVQMPEMDGFEVVAKIGVEKMPAVLFATAYDEFALRAFEVHALDYLLKPFSQERFQEAVGRATSYIRQQDNGNGSSDGKTESALNTLEARLQALLNDIQGGETQYLQRVTIKLPGRLLFMPTDEVDWIETAGNYLRIHAGKEAHLIRETMAQIETQLDPRRFARIHRSTLVNIERVKELRPLFNGDHKVILRDGQHLMLSRSYRDKLLGLLERSSSKPGQ